MASPTPFDRQTSFAQFSAEFPALPQNGTSLDAEFNAVKLALDETQGNLGLVQSADGGLQQGIVGRPQLDASVMLGFAAPTSWAPGVEYIANVSTVFRLGIFYIATVTHISGVTFSSLNWRQLADLTASTAIDDLSITEPKLANGAVTSPKIAPLAVASGNMAPNAVTNSKIAPNAVSTDKASSAAQWQAFILPVGLGPLPYSGYVAPPGWVFTGATYLRTDYPALWLHAQTAINNGSQLFGAGDGVTTFTIRDIRGRNIVDWDPNQDVIAGANILGGVGGEHKHALSVAELPTVTPTFTGTSGAVGVVSNTADVVKGVVVDTTAGTAGSIKVLSAGSAAGALNSSGNFTPVGVVSSFGSGVPHSNVQPLVASRHIIKAH